MANKFGASTNYRTLWSDDSQIRDRVNRTTGSNISSTPVNRTATSLSSINVMGSGSGRGVAYGTSTDGSSVNLLSHGDGNFSTIQKTRYGEVYMPVDTTNTPVKYNYTPNGTTSYIKETAMTGGTAKITGADGISYKIVNGEVYQDTGYTPSSTSTSSYLGSSTYGGNSSSGVSGNYSGLSSTGSSSYGSGSTSLNGGQSGSVSSESTSLNLNGLDTENINGTTFVNFKGADGTQNSVPVNYLTQDNVNSIKNGTATSRDVTNWISDSGLSRSDISSGRSVSGNYSGLSSTNYSSGNSSSSYGSGSTSLNGGQSGSVSSGSTSLNLNGLDTENINGTTFVNFKGADGTQNSVPVNYLTQDNVNSIKSGTATSRDVTNWISDSGLSRSDISSGRSVSGNYSDLSSTSYSSGNSSSSSTSSPKSLIDGSTLKEVNLPSSLSAADRNELNSYINRSKDGMSSAVYLASNGQSYEVQNGKVYQRVSDITDNSSVVNKRQGGPASVTTGSTVSGSSSNTSTLSSDYATATSGSVGIANMSYGRSTTGMNKLKSNFQSDIDKAVNYLGGSEYQNLINTVSRYWTGPDADKFIKEIQKMLSQDAASFKTYNKTVQDALSSDLSYFDKSQVNNANNITRIN